MRSIARMIARSIRPRRLASVDRGLPSGRLRCMSLMLSFWERVSHGKPVKLKAYAGLLFIISSHAGGCAFCCHPHGDNRRPRGHEPPHQRGSIQQTCERHATISMRYRTASPAGVYKELVPRDPLLLAPYEWMCLLLPFIRGTREGSKGRPRRGCQ